MARHGHLWSLASLPLPLPRPLPEKHDMERTGEARCREERLGYDAGAARLGRRCCARADTDRSGRGAVVRPAVLGDGLEMEEFGWRGAGWLLICEGDGWRARVGFRSAKATAGWATWLRNSRLDAAVGGEILAARAAARRSCGRRWLRHYRWRFAFMGNSIIAEVLGKGKAGLKVVLEASKVILTKNKHFVDKGYLSDGLFVLNTLTMNANVVAPPLLLYAANVAAPTVRRTAGRRRSVVYVAPLEVTFYAARLLRCTQPAVLRPHTPTAATLLYAVVAHANLRPHKSKNVAVPAARVNPSPHFAGKSLLLNV
ncbi:ty1-copia retrotransposon protein [Cucumis melo var. makuwa]|uniref:Ty1-copia retrotransposon protein n=1 Tax=Cucumis melo var. makuwa TaxID=1194695 RepID=A0A5A7U5X3_CUCMM|nr:ty1-copia retrotransposon protein [Cucumis melo var. makuwa]